jgi:hypothetical protein
MAAPVSFWALSPLDRTASDASYRMGDYRNRRQGETAMLTGILGLCIMVMRLCPGTPTARYLHHHCVARPVAWLGRLERRHLLFAMVTVGALLLAGEMIGMLGSADLMLAWTWDLTVYFDAAAVTVVLARVARVTPVVAIARRRLMAWFARSTRSRCNESDTTKSLRTASADNDEDHPNLYVQAA